MEDLHRGSSGRRSQARVGRREERIEGEDVDRLERGEEGGERAGEQGERSGAERRWGSEVVGIGDGEPEGCGYREHEGAGFAEGAGELWSRRGAEELRSRRAEEKLRTRRAEAPERTAARPVERGRKPRVEWGAFEGPSSSADWESSELKRSRVDVASADFARLSAATASLHEGRHSHPNAASNVRLIGQTPSNGGRSAQASRPAQASFPWVPSPAAANDVRSSSSRLRTTSTGDVEGSEPVKRARTTSETANARTGLALHQPAPCRLSSNLLVSRLSRRLTRGSLHRGTGPIDPVPPRARSLRPPRLSPSRTDSDRSRDVPELHRQRLPPSERPLNPRVPADLGTTKQAPGRRSSPRTAHSRRARRTVELSCRTPVGRTRASKRGLVVESL